MRKTLEIEAIKQKANKFFRVTPNDWTLQREAIQAFVNTLLHETGNYKGFQYLTENQVDKGLTFGIEFFEGGNKRFDESRIYFI